VKTHHSAAIGPDECAEIAAHQAKGLTVAAISVGKPIDLAAMRSAGVDLRRVLVSEPDSVEQAAHVESALLRSGVVDAVFLAQPAAAGQNTPG
jgi:RecA/RadA recombinase